MKKEVAFLAALFFCTSISYTQPTTSNTGYASTRLGLGIGIGQEIAFNSFASVHFKRGFYTGFHYLATSLKSRTIPEDYIAGTRFFTKSDRAPRDHFASHSLMIGQELGRLPKRFTFSVETGISWVIYSEALFSRQRQTPGFFGPIGDFNGYKTYNQTGLLMNGKLSFKCCEGINLELSTYANINSSRNVVTENLSLVFDFLRQKNKINAVENQK